MSGVWVSWWPHRLADIEIKTGASNALENTDTIYIDLDSEAAMQPADLIDHLDLLMLSGGMSDGLRGVLTDYLSAMPADNGTQRAVDAVFLVATSPEFAVQK